MVRWVVALLVVGVGCGGSDERDGGVLDAAVDSSRVVHCEVDADCANGLFCDGAERCAPGAPGADAITGCLAGPPPCIDADCDESSDQCGFCRDEDGDGKTGCEGDCDDLDARVFRGASETCDAAGLDEDCDPRTYGFLDVDEDGAADRNCFNIDPSTATRFAGTDCNDNDAAVHPRAREVCDGLGIDEDCDSRIDEECTCVPEGRVRPCETNLGACRGSTQICTLSGWSDCTPVAPVGETSLACDHTDNDCDGLVDEGVSVASACSRRFVAPFECTGASACERMFRSGLADGAWAAGWLATSVPAPFSRRACESPDPRRRTRSSHPAVPRPWSSRLDRPLVRTTVC